MASNDGMSFQSNHTGDFQAYLFFPSKTVKNWEMSGCKIWISPPILGGASYKKIWASIPNLFCNDLKLLWKFKSQQTTQFFALVGRIAYLCLKSRFMPHLDSCSVTKQYSCAWVRVHMQFKACPFLASVSFLCHNPRYQLWRGFCFSSGRGMTG